MQQKGGHFCPPNCEYQRKELYKEILKEYLHITYFPIILVVTKV